MIPAVFDRLRVHPWRRPAQEADLERPSAGPARTEGRAPWREPYGPDPVVFGPDYPRGAPTDTAVELQDDHGVAAAADLHAPVVAAPARAPFRSLFAIFGGDRLKFTHESLLSGARRMPAAPGGGDPG